VEELILLHHLEDVPFVFPYLLILQLLHNGRHWSLEVVWVDCFTSTIDNRHGEWHLKHLLDLSSSPHTGGLLEKVVGWGLLNAILTHRYTVLVHLDVNNRPQHFVKLNSVVSCKQSVECKCGVCSLVEVTLQSVSRLSSVLTQVHTQVVHHISHSFDPLIYIKSTVLKATVRLYQ